MPIKELCNHYDYNNSCNGADRLNKICSLALYIFQYLLNKKLFSQLIEELFFHRNTLSRVKSYRDSIIVNYLYILTQNDFQVFSCQTVGTHNPTDYFNFNIFLSIIYLYSLFLLGLLFLRRYFFFVVYFRIEI